MITKLNRDDRISVTINTEEFFGLNIVDTTPVDITVDKIPDEAFERVQQIVRLLTTKREELAEEEIEEKYETGDDGSIVYVAVGNRSGSRDKLRTIFNGDYVPTLLIVGELEKILKEHATAEDLVLKS